MARSRSPTRSRAPRHAHRDRQSDREKDRERDRDRGAPSRRRSRSRSRSRSRGRRREDEPSGRSGGDGDGDARGPKTEDKNGEISMSVEETNKLRAQLGLKPLAVGPKKTAEVNLQKTSAQLAQEREQKQIQQALAQSRKKRELSHKLAGPSLGEQLRAEADARDALSWVKQSRGKTKQAAQQQEKEKKTQDAGGAYDASALAGMTVGHAADAFEEGQEVVLTLKDTSVLAADGNDVNDEDDELVNVELSERDRRSAQQSRAERAMMPAYTGYDDDEFVQMGNPRAKKRQGGGKKLLAQYDEDDDARVAEEARKFTLDASGTSTAAVVRGDKEEAAGGADEDDDGVAVISLAMDRTKAAEDYFTAEEMETQFKKKGKKLRKKKKKMRHREEAEQAEEEAAEGDTSSLIAQLEAEAKRNAGQDRGKRKRRHAQDDDDDGAVIAEDQEGLKRFQNARDKANVVASEALAASDLAVEGGDVVQASTSTQSKRKRRAVGGVDEDVAMMDEALDLELSASLARARRLAQLQEAKQEQQNRAVEAMQAGKPAVPPVLAGPASEDKIALLVRNTVGVEANGPGSDTKASESESVAPKPVGNVFGQAPGTMGSSTNTVVFNDATDFETRLRNAMEKRAAQFQAVATPGIVATGSINVASGQQNALSNSAGADEEMKGEDTNDDAEMKEEEDDDEEDKDTNDVFGEEQPLVSSGLGATLALLKKTGDLRETRVERQAGRANDSRDRNVDEERRIKDGVKLDYRDEFGRLLTKKEAFRMLSYKFHGHGPGKKKQEKRLRQLKQELEAQKLLSAEGSTKMMEVLEKKQKAGKQAHVVLSSGT
jgi:U4/U6.U5 tri-snRNP-associated protein 1